MKRISHDTLSTVINVVYLGLITNALLVATCLPVVLLLITTDPAKSWPLIAIAAPFAAPGITSAFSAFRQNSRGGNTPARSFLAGWRATWRRALTLGAITSAVLVVLLVDVKALAAASIGVAIVPLLGVLTALVLAIALVGLVAISEEPAAPLRRVIRLTAYLSLRRWYLSIVSLLVIGAQFAVFASMPAVGLGLTAAPALYLAWANSRYTLRPALDTDDAAALPAIHGRTSH